uniref:Uncharacterized protein n=1 Tax=Acanthochromis polyacanthus TaxID=80966 RepID=A0A3Q1GR86_9TELE
MLANTSVAFIFLLSVKSMIFNLILDNNFVVVRCKDLVWRKQDSERFYAEHSGIEFVQKIIVRNKINMII